MAFSLADLENFTVERIIEPRKGYGFKIHVAVIDDKQEKEINKKNSDFETCKALIKGVEGYTDKSGNEMPVDLFLKDAAKFPGLILACAAECWYAQREAFLKN